MRLNRFLAASGFGSRRSCERLIAEGKVSINGHFIRDLATRVVEGDQVLVAGRPARPPRSATVVALHKPPGFICTRDDERGRKTIYDLLPRGMRGLGYVGRLDRDSEGLLLLTDDGGLAQDLSRPGKRIEKEYEVILDQHPDAAAIAKLTRGFQIEAGRAKIERLTLEGERAATVVLCQGLKRQIREMFFRVGCEVKRLVRVRVGPIRLGNLPRGAWRPLEKREITALKKIADQAPADHAPEPTSRPLSRYGNRKSLPAKTVTSRAPRARVRRKPLAASHGFEP